MTVGLGTTVLAKGEITGHLDGIAVYTKHLLNALPLAGTEISNFAFLTAKQSVQYQRKHTALGKFSYQGLLSATTGLPLLTQQRVEQKVSLFHATDHQIPRLKNIPVVATIMDPIPLIHPEWVGGGNRQLKNWFFKKSAHWADHIITISDYSADAIEEHFNIPKSRISVVPLGVDEQCFTRSSEQQKQTILAKYNLPENYFIFIGTLQPRKNVERLLAAFLQLPLAVQQTHPLVIVGRHGWNCETLIEQLTALKDSKRVYWLDYVPFEDKYPLLQSSVAMVFPSLFEGFGLPVLEAFASEIPVITSNVTSLPEVAGDAALLVDPYSLDEMTGAMLNIANDSSLQSELVHKGLQRVATFSWQQTAKQTALIYDSMS